MSIINYIQSDPATSWLVAGAFMMVLEILATGIGFLFAGVAAILVGLVINFNLVNTDNFVAQVAVFFALTTAIAGLLWKKLKSIRVDSNSEDSFTNMVGDNVFITDGELKKGFQGKVKWSGTIMNAQIHANSVKNSFLEGEAAQIKSVDGNVLFVIEK